MSNLTGNYKISLGEVQGVDVLREREQERRARMQLLDDIREPSPQPIFGEPVKVDLEDETSRRIKNTLGDFTQVLINDPKNLIGISRSTGSGHQNGHHSNGYSSSGHPVNGYSMSGHQSGGHMGYMNSGYSSSGHSNTGHSSMNAPSTGSNAPFVKPNNLLLYHKKSHYAANGSCAIKQSVNNYVSPNNNKAIDKRGNYNRSAPKSGYASNFNKPESPAAPPKLYHPPSESQQSSNQSYEFRRDSNTYIEKSHDKLEQQRSVGGSSSSLNSKADSNSSVQNAVNTMYATNVSNTAPIWNCGPDTPAIQLRPFRLPSNATPSSTAKSSLDYEQNNHPYNAPPPPAKGDSDKSGDSWMRAKGDSSDKLTPPKRNQFRPNSITIQPEKKEAPLAVETILKEMTKVVPPAPLTAIQTPRTEETGFAFPTAEPKEDTSFFKEIENICLIEPFDEDKPAPEPKPKDTSQLSPKPYVSSLQDDLEMSDSDEETGPIAESFPEQSLLEQFESATQETARTTEANTAESTNKETKMDTNSAESSNSSSSESGDSDSDDSSSESNDSDSSSEASDEEVSSKKWGLSNFVDESQRMHSPRFFQGDAAKGNLRLQNERMKNLALGNVNSFNNTSTVKDTPSLPATEQKSSFLVPDVPVAAKSEILSPIPSPVHPAVGPRTPPSPNVLNQDSKEANVESAQTKSDKSDSSEARDSLVKSPLPDAASYDEKTRKQLRSGASKVELEKLSSPKPDRLSEDNLNDLKDNSQGPVLKDDNASDVEKSASSSGASNNTETPDNYSIKTRQRVSALSAKKTKSSENSQKVDGETSAATAKPKLPRACRKPNEKPFKKPAASTTPSKSDSNEQAKKRSKPEVKEKPPPVSEKSNDSVKSANIKTVKPPRKNKTPKVPQKEKEVPEVKKSEPKKKKFAIENFVQSPEITGPTKGPQVFSPSPERSPLPDSEKTSEADLPPSKTSSKTSTKSSDKNVEKLRRSARCSERATHTVPAEASDSTPSSDGKKTSKTMGKTKSQMEGVLVVDGGNVELLSPIPAEPSVSSETGDIAIPFKIMVCIPFFKLSRLPAAVKQARGAENVEGYRSRSASIDDGKSQKDSASPDRLSKTTKRSSSKDVKDKNKVANPVKSTKSVKNVPSDKKDKDLKTSSDNSGKSKTVPTVNKTSAKIKSKPHCDDAENTLLKKRKIESNDQQVKRKKVSRTGEEKKPKESTSIKSDLSTPIVNNEETSKHNSLERCDSTGSLSSLCSQQSQRSSKSVKEKKKESPGSAPESKRLKSSTAPVKQEKEDRSKVHVKKEPRPSDKNKGKPRDKITSKDIPEKCSEIGDDSCFSSQLQYIWDDTSSDDPKAQISSNWNLGDDTDLPDWDHFAPDKLKEASLNKHSNQTPIMPMDYYYTEGRKQKQLAEKEKDPFQQAVKFFEAAVLFILTSQQKEEYTKDPEIVYQFYDRTLKYFGDIQTKVKNLHSCPGSTEFKLLILCLKCQSLLNVKLYNIKIKEIKEQIDGVTEFLHNYNTTFHSRHSSCSSIPSPHSSIPSPATSVNTQSSGYGSMLGNEMGLRSTTPGTLNVPQNMLDMICRQHTHLINLHRGHDNWEQADMYMTRSNLREFFKEVADQSEPLTLHSSITELVKYIQKGISMVKKSLR